MSNNLKSNIKCPQCRQAIEIGSKLSKYFPFCSERCKMVDLGTWLDSGYKIADPPVNEDLTDYESAGL